MIRYLRYPIYVYLVLSAMLLQTSCSVIDKAEPIPAYLRITNIELTTPSDNSQGSSSSNVTDAWVYFNDNLQGVYPMPTRFPVLLSGKNSIRIRAGIVQNGIDATRIDYPFYNDWDSTLELTEKEILSLKPRINGYKSGTVFHCNEGFEGIGIDFEKTVSSVNDIVKTSNSNIVFEGNNCGKFEILSGTIDVTIASNKYYTLPKQGASVFLEMNYNINQVMEVGVIALNGAQVSQRSVIGLRATTTSSGTTAWKKVYIDLTEAVSSETTASGYKVYFYAKQDANVSNPLFYIDNVKLISF